MLRSRFPASWDLVVAMAVALAGAIAAKLLPDASAVRVVLALSALFLVPGYLLMQASLREVPDARRRGRDVLLALGLSLPVVGLLALLGALVPDGFGAGGFAIGLLAGCMGLACTAFVRRSRSLAPAPVAMTQPIGSTE